MEYLGRYALKRDAPELDQHGEKLQNGFSESFLYADISERKELHLSLRPRKWGSKYLDTLQQAQHAKLVQLRPSLGQKRKTCIEDEAQLSQKRICTHLQKSQDDKKATLQSFAASSLPASSRENSPYTFEDEQAMWDICNWRMDFKQGMGLLQSITFAAGRRGDKAASSVGRSKQLQSWIIEGLQSHFESLRQYLEDSTLQAAVHPESTSSKYMSRAVCLSCGSLGRQWAYLTAFIAYLCRETFISAGMLLALSKKQLVSDPAPLVDAALRSFRTALLYKVPGKISSEEH